MRTGDALRLTAVLAAALVLAACGLEDYPFIYPVPQGSIRQYATTRSEVPIPTNNAGTTFTHFIVFYRIYVSDVLVSATSSSSSYSAINQDLLTDYNAIFPYIDSTTLVNTNMETLFLGRKFQYLYLQGADIDDVLSSGVLGRTLVFDFPSGRYPTLTIDGAVYNLYRSNGNGTFDLQPKLETQPLWYRYFVNSSDLSSSAYSYTPTNTTQNADVVNNSGASSYTYAAMYIAAMGVDNSTYTNIYSTPSLIHVFLLPDQWQQQQQ